MVGKGHQIFLEDDGSVRGVVELKDGKMSNLLSIPNIETIRPR